MKPLDRERLRRLVEESKSWPPWRHADLGSMAPECVTPRVTTRNTVRYAMPVTESDTLIDYPCGRDRLDVGKLFNKLERSRFVNSEKNKEQTK